MMGRPLEYASETEMLSEWPSAHALLGQARNHEGCRLHSNQALSLEFKLVEQMFRALCSYTS